MQWGRLWPELVAVTPTKMVRVKLPRSERDTKPAMPTPTESEGEMRTVKVRPELV